MLVSLLLLAQLAQAVPPAAQAPARDTIKAPRDTTYIASAKGTVYYANVVGCNATRTLAPKNLIHFKTAREAEATGRRRSRTPGC